MVLYFMSVSQWYYILCQSVSDIVFYKSISGIISQSVVLYFMSVSQWYCILCKSVNGIVFYVRQSVVLYFSGIVFYVSQSMVYYFM